MIRLEVNGQPFDNWISISFSRSMEQLSGSFSFVASKADQTAFPIKRRSSVRVVVNDTPLITGFMDALTPFISSSENRVNIQGRDKTQDLIDSTLNASTIELNAPISLSRVIETVISRLGLDINVINNVSDLEDFTQEDIISAESGQGAFDFIEKFARKRQVLLTSDGDGNVVITRSSNELINYQIINRKDGQGNNVKSATIAYDDSKRFNQYIVVSQENLVTSNNFGQPDLEQVVDVENSPVIDPEIRPGRILHIVAEKSSSPDEALKRAQWEANFRKSQSLKYNSTTDDFLIPDTEQPFPINRLVTVNDEDNDIQSIMLIEAISLNLDVGGGSRTSFSLVPRNAYTLQLEEPQTEESTNTIGIEEFL